MENNSKLIFFLILLICFFILILLPIYMLLIIDDEELKKLVDEKTYSQIQNVKNENDVISSDDSMFYFPVDNFITITATYGYYDPYNSGKLQKHTGIDICGKKNSNIFASLDGKVVFAGWNNNGYGNMVKILHNINGVKFYTLYAHMKNNSLKVYKGQQIKKGTIIGTQGSTGNSTGQHLHFELINIDGNTIDPYPYLFLGII